MTSLIDQEYMKEHHLQTYLEDAVGEYLVYGESGNNGHAMTPREFFQEYFRSVQEGGHVFFRNFIFASATPYNRLCVLKAIMQIYRPLLHKERWYDAKDCHSLLKLVWSDFPIQVVRDAFTAFDDDKKNEENRLKFIDFLRAFKASFCTGEFNYEESIIKTEIEKKIDEFSNISLQTGKTSKNLRVGHFLEDDEINGSRLTSRMSDIQYTLNNVFSCGDDKSSGGKSEVYSFESKYCSNTEGNKKKTEKKSIVKSKHPCAANSKNNSKDKFKSKVFKQKFKDGTEYKGTFREKFKYEHVVDKEIVEGNFRDQTREGDEKHNETLVEKSKEMDEKKKPEEIDENKTEESGDDKFKESFRDNQKSNGKFEDSSHDRDEEESKDKFEDKPEGKEKVSSHKRLEQKTIAKFGSEDKSKENFIIAKRKRDIFNITFKDNLEQNKEELRVKSEHKSKQEEKDVSNETSRNISTDTHKTKAKFVGDKAD